MNKPTIEQVLAAFADKDEGSRYHKPFTALYERKDRTISVRIATDGKALAACLETLDAAAMPIDERLALVRSEPSNARELLASGHPQYWTALRDSSDDDVGSLNTGLDASLFARVALAQVRITAETAERIERRKATFGADVKKAASSRGDEVRLLSKGSVTKQSIEDYAAWKALYERRRGMIAVCELRQSHRLSPIFWSVCNPCDQRYYLDEAWVGAVMPCRL